MKISDANALTKSWVAMPPTNEVLAILARAYTTWRGVDAPTTEEERRAEHRRSLEARWNAGAMNAKQIFEALGGGANGVSVRIDGSAQADAGITDFPGQH
jgi:hypothetical protein